MTKLSSDRPRMNPQDDLFVNAAFAESLTNSVCRYTADSGLLLSLLMIDEE